ncbi:uncharacterized protein LOC135071523 isoform X2 [Ostrinia nubilalis]
MGSMHSPLSFDYLKKEFQNAENAYDQARPISCPVCAKMIVMSSILVHFYFDHSKVLKLSLSKSTRQHIVIKASDISLETKCIAVLLLADGKSSTGNIQQKPINNKLHAFLMAAKMSTWSPLNSNVGVLKDKCIMDQVHENQSKLPNIRSRFEENDVILFWTCKTHNHELICNVKLSRKDKKLSFSYTGEAIDIREKQDAKNIYRNIECLVLRGGAANKLLDKEDQLNVFVRYLR